MRKLILVIIFLLIPLFVTVCYSDGQNEGFGLAGICRNDPRADLCNHKYALCIAASCDPATMTDSTIECGHCDRDDGSCGYCYVFEGLSCSYNAPCSEVRPSGNIVYSTYSQELSFGYGFKASLCGAEETVHVDCMDALCTLTGETVALEDVHGATSQIPTAICECRIRKESPATTDKTTATLGGQCNTENCSAIWSTASDSARGVLDHVPQCTDSE